MSLSRRHVLASLAAGGAGALTGTGTGAFLNDAEGGRTSLTTGLVDLRVEYWLVSGPGSSGGIDLDDPDGVVDGPRVDVPVETLDGDDPRGSMLVRFALPQPEDGVNNPASLWLQTACPTPDPLAEFLEVRLSYATANGTIDTTIAEGSLREVAEQLRAGVRLDQPMATDEDGCLTDELFVLVEYDLGIYVGEGTTSLPLYVAATQCRNGDPTNNPFEPVAETDCPPGYVCDCCWGIGKVELGRDDDGTDEQFQVGETYEFTEGLVGYGLDVTDVDDDSGVAFELVATEGGAVPPLCEVRVKGGRNEEVYQREDDAYGTTTDVLDGTTDGLVSTPGSGYGISYVLVKVCAPEVDGRDCPADLANSANSGDGGSDDRPGKGKGRGR